MNPLSNSYSFCLLFILSLFSVKSAKSERDAVSIIHREQKVNIENASVAISNDLSKGTYSAFNKIKNTTCISGAYFTLNDLQSSDNFVYTWSTSFVKDDLGRGKKLIVTGKKKDFPALILEITVYEGKGFFVVNSGVVNTTDSDLRIKKFSPLTAKAFEGFTFNDFKTLDGESGGYQTHVSSTDTLNCFNNLLVTFGDKGLPKSSLVIGGLTYNEFQNRLIC